ncbi:uncharacterized protein LOC119840494 [Zerene cesonia]|uniref:uncharacterized protein LOC119840494 n=1 Tax=Zerene cesonia TaxID=33412 RepID=UPI0018E4F19A|nr:uncharacterized protein LOC119840494 [Zerene cesonia]
MTMDHSSLLYISAIVTVLQYAQSAPSELPKVNVQSQGQYTQAVSNKASLVKEDGLSSRFPAIEDDRLNWGVMVDPLIHENEEAFNRPITIRRKILKSNKIAKGTVLMNEERTPPQNIDTSKNNKVNIGPQSIASSSSKSNTDVVNGLQIARKALEKPKQDRTAIQCDAAIISCCSNKRELQWQCQIAKECLSSFSVCEIPIIQRSIDNMIFFYTDSS